MAAKLTQEISDALRTNGEGRLEFVDPSTNRTYVLVESEQHCRAMEALRREEEDWAAIQEGIAASKAGDTIPLEEADRQIREEFGFAPQS